MISFKKFLSESNLTKIKSEHGWAVRNGYFPNGKLAVKWDIEEKNAHLFDDIESKSICARARHNGLQITLKQESK